MSIVLPESPRSFKTALRSLPGFTTATFTAPPEGASLFTYLATVSLLTIQPPDGIAALPDAPSVDELADYPGFDWLNGPAGRQLGKGDASVPLQLGPADFELGVIAGNRTIDPITSAVLPNPDDGRVSVDDTKLEGMADFVVVDHSHAFMMRMRRSIELTIRFLRTGRFQDPAAVPGTRP